jgi:hypothetical protein
MLIAPGSAAEEFGHLFCMFPGPRARFLASLPLGGFRLVVFGAGGMASVGVRGDSV